MKISIDLIAKSTCVLLGIVLTVNAAIKGREAATGLITLKTC